MRATRSTIADSSCMEVCVLVSIASLPVPTGGCDRNKYDTFSLHPHPVVFSPIPASILFLIRYLYQKKCLSPHNIQFKLYYIVLQMCILMLFRGCYESSHTSRKFFKHRNKVYHT